VSLRGRGGIAILLVVAAVVGCWFAWRESASRRRMREDSAPTIYKEAIVFASHTFDPAAPPAEMPPLGAGENAECDSDFRSSANVRGETRLTDDSHATVTITQVTMTLRLNITIWVPIGAAARVIEHEEGHREISEYYYQGADTLARRIAAKYLGRQVEIRGADLNVETNEMLLKMANGITEEYGKELDPGPAQLLYDTITDHGRNDVVVKDAVEHALKNVSIEWMPPKTGGN
jgi:hypothetical protein